MYQGLFPGGAVEVLTVLFPELRQSRAEAGEGAGGGGTAIALPLVIRLIVGNWDCFSRGALNAETGQCPNGECGGDDQHLCAAA